MGSHSGFAQALLDPLQDTAKPVSVEKKALASEKNGNLIRVVAPCAMGAGSSLYVICNGATYVVKIPQGGVEDGQDFVAEGRRKRPITGEWRDGLFDFFPGMEGSFCTTAFCCGSLAFACLMEPLKMDCFYRRNSPIPHRVVFTFMCVLVLVGIYNTYQLWGNYYSSATYVLLELYLISIFVAVRVFTRIKYKIPGNCCMDCLAVYFCFCCSALQIFRHMKSSGDEPAMTRMSKTVEGTLETQDYDYHEMTTVVEAKTMVLDDDHEEGGGEESNGKMGVPLVEAMMV